MGVRWEMISECRASASDARLPRGLIALRGLPHDRPCQCSRMNPLSVCVYGQALGSDTMFSVPVFWKQLLEILEVLTAGALESSGYKVVVEIALSKALCSRRVGRVGKSSTVALQ